MKIEKLEALGAAATSGAAPKVNVAPWWVPPWWVPKTDLGGRAWWVAGGAGPPESHH